MRFASILPSSFSSLLVVRFEESPDSGFVAELFAASIYFRSCTEMLKFDPLNSVTESKGNFFIINYIK